MAYNPNTDLLVGLKFNIADRFASVVQQGTVGSTFGVLALAEGFKRKLGNKADTLAANEVIAFKMRAAVANSFAQTVKTHSGQYRVGERSKGGSPFLNRYSGGALRRAVLSPEIAVADAEGISYVDSGRLTKEAAHWMRLNFGAGGRDTTGNARVAVKFDGAQVFNVGFSVQQRAAFTMPFGVFKNSKGIVEFSQSNTPGRDKFYPQGKKKYPTRGIRGAHFFDAGLRALALNFPLEYDKVLSRWYGEIQGDLLPERITLQTGRNALGQFTSNRPRSG